MTRLPPDAPLILLVEDDDVFRQRLARAFESRGYRVQEARDLASALSAVRSQPPQYAVVDLRLPGGSGLELVRVAGAGKSTRIVVLTGYGSIATALAAVRLGAVDYVTKPVDVDDILKALFGDPGVYEAANQWSHEAASLARVEWEHINRVLA